jgi:hypothetical protein
MTGSRFPLSHTRRYLERTKTTDSSITELALMYSATILAGSQDSIDYDAVAELTFEDQTIEFSSPSQGSGPEHIMKAPSTCNNIMAFNSNQSETINSTQAAFYTFFRQPNSPENAAKIAADGALFMDISKTAVVVLSDCVETTR